MSVVGCTTASVLAWTTLREEKRGIMIPADPFPNGGENFWKSLCGYACGDKKVNQTIEGYDYLSRPYTILPTVPTVHDDIDPTNPKILWYEPFGTTTIFPFSEARKHLPLMKGETDHWYKSVNIATYKNFSYGYRIRKISPGVYADLNGEFPMDLPEDWNDQEIVPSTEFPFGKKYFDHAKAARFKIYDLRQYMEDRGQAGFFLITARLRKFKVEMWSTRVARGFWEVVPADLFDSLEEIEAAIKNGNDENWFRLNYTGDGKKHFRYRLASSREVVHLSQYYGAVFNDLWETNEGTVQGIIGLEDQNGEGYNLKDVFLRFMDNDFMNQLPLIDAKAVNDDYTFEEDAEGNMVFYACAKDGWLAVNNPRDGSYLFADSRRGSGFEDDPDSSTPYWMSGVFENEDPWGVECGAGIVGEWIPAPPENGAPEECSNPEICPNVYFKPDLLPRYGCVDYDALGLPQAILLVISNIGKADAEESTARILLSGGFHHDEPIPFLTSGANFFKEIPIPNPLIGDYPFIIKADVDEIVEEINEENNRKIGICLPDLISNFECAYYNANGLPQTILVTITNQGTARAAESSARVDFETGHHNEPVPALVPGANFQSEIAIPDSLTEYFAIKADADEIVKEFSEENNKKIGICKKKEDK